VGHDEHTDRLERELDDMERQSEQLSDTIDGAREDWERKKRDSSVPGASGESEADEAGGEGADPQPESEDE
jgi:predicted  nucleic acid-binding Zn-ribbon protein